VSSRESIFERLKQAAAEPTAPYSPFPADEDLYADMPGEDLLEAFSDHVQDLAGEIYVVDSVATAAATVQELIGEDGALHDGAELTQAVLQALPQLQEHVALVDQRTSPDFSQVNFGLTSADVLIARTGTIALRNTSAGGRRLSILPPTHIVLARRSQLVPSLQDAVPLLTGDWSYATFITGPSRTADIEKILVLGAHGPKRLCVVVITD